MHGAEGLTVTKVSLEIRMWDCGGASLLGFCLVGLGLMKLPLDRTSKLRSGDRLIYTSISTSSVAIEAQACGSAYVRARLARSVAEAMVN